MKFSIGRFDKSETRTEGLTTGGYSVDLPDGRTQVSLSLFWSLKVFINLIFGIGVLIKQYNVVFIKRSRTGKKGLKRPKQP